MNVTRHDADFAFARGDNAWAVRADHANASFVQLHFHGQHIQGRDTFGDGDNQLNARVDSLQNGVFAERRRNVDDGRSRAGGFNGFAHGVKYRQAQVGGAAFTWRYAANHLSAVSDRLFRVECTLATGKALADNLGVFIN